MTDSSQIKTRQDLIDLWDFDPSDPNGVRDLYCGRNDVDCQFNGGTCGSNPTEVVDKSFFTQYYVELDVVSTKTGTPRNLTVAISVPKNFREGKNEFKLMFHFGFATWNTGCGENWISLENIGFGEYKLGLTPLGGAQNYDSLQLIMHSCVANGIVIVHFPQEQYGYRATYPCYENANGTVAIDPTLFVEPPSSAKCEACLEGHLNGPPDYGQDGGCPISMLTSIEAETCWNQGNNIDRRAIDAVLEHLHTNKSKYSVDLTDVSIMGYSGNGNFVSMCLQTFEGLQTSELNLPYPIPKSAFLVSGGSYQCYFQEQKMANCYGTSCNPSVEERGFNYRGCCPDWFSEKKFLGQNQKNHPPTVFTQTRRDGGADPLAGEYYKDAQPEAVTLFKQDGSFHGLMFDELETITKLVIQNAIVEPIGDRSDSCDPPKLLVFFFVVILVIILASTLLIAFQ